MLWDLTHRGFAKNQRDELFPEYPFPWGLESEEEFYEVQEKLEKFAVRLVSKMQDAKGRGKSLEGWDCHPTGRGRLDLKGSTKEDTAVILGSLPPSKDLCSMCWGKGLEERLPNLRPGVQHVRTSARGASARGKAQEVLSVQEYCGGRKRAG